MVPTCRLQAAVAARAGASSDVRIAVLGASGYTGEEVVRLLALHPAFRVTALTGDRQAGKVRRRGPAARTAHTSCPAPALPHPTPPHPTPLASGVQRGVSTPGGSRGPAPADQD